MNVFHAHFESVEGPPPLLAQDAATWEFFSGPKVRGKKADGSGDYLSMRVRNDINGKQ